MFKTYLAAAALAVGTAGQAGAATFTVAEYDLTLRYEGTKFIDAIVFNPFDDEPAFFEGDIAIGDETYGVVSPIFGTIPMGSNLNFRFKLTQPAEEYYESYAGNGGRAPICQFGPLDCTSTNFVSIEDNTISFAFEDKFWTSFELDEGSVFDVGIFSEFARNVSDFPSFLTTDGLNGFYYWDEISSFTILDVNDLAVVPLPAAWALMPLGFGGLALIRRRRRSATGGRSDH